MQARACRLERAAPGIDVLDPPRRTCIGARLDHPRIAWIPGRSEPDQIESLAAAPSLSRVGRDRAQILRLDLETRRTHRHDTVPASRALERFPRRPGGCDPHRHARSLDGRLKGGALDSIVDAAMRDG